MPAKYDPARALPLQVDPAMRAELDALVASAPAALRLNRNMVAVAALTRGLVQLRAELARDPMAVHRALVGEAPALSPSTEHTSTKASAHTGPAPRPPRARAECAPVAVEGGDVDAAAVLVRFLASGVKVAPFAKAHGVARSTLQMWATGKRPLPAAALARVVKGLDAME
jgi:hypothetical protein